MPELPDVEVIRLNIQPDIVGRIFTHVALNWPGSVRSPSPGEFQEALLGSKVADLRRRAKYFLFELNTGESLIVHLGMTGSLRLTPAREDMHRFTQTVFELDDGRHLRYVDPRKLGRMWLVEDVSTVIGGLGPEPLEPPFTPLVLSGILKNRTASIKALLCDQGLIAGIGNIYADEILFDAKVHPLKTGNQLSEGEIGALHSSIQKILSEAIDNLKDMLPEDAPPTEEAGMEVIRVPRNNGQACSVCSSPIQRTVVRGRGTYFCSNCQPL